MKGYEMICMEGCVYIGYDRVCGTCNHRFNAYSSSGGGVQGTHSDFDVTSRVTGGRERDVGTRSLLNVKGGGGGE